MGMMLPHKSRRRGNHASHRHALAHSRRRRSPSVLGDRPEDGTVLTRSGLVHYQREQKTIK